MAEDRTEFNQNIRSILGEEPQNQVQSGSENIPTRMTVEDYTVRRHKTTDAGASLNGVHPTPKPVVEIKSREPHDIQVGHLPRIPVRGRDFR